KASGEEYSVPTIRAKAINLRYYSVFFPEAKCLSAESRGSLLFAARCFLSAQHSHRFVHALSAARYTISLGLWSQGRGSQSRGNTISELHPPAAMDHSRYRVFLRRALLSR